MRLLEDPLLILFWGTLVVAITAVAWVQTQHPRALLALIATGILLVFALGIEQLVITPREEIEQTLDLIARALETNDSSTVVEYLAPAATDLRREIQQRMRTLKIEKISIKSNLEVHLGTASPPRTAEARFNVVGTFAAPGDLSQPIVIPRFLIVQVLRQDDRWLVLSYEDFDPRGPQAR